MRAIAQSITVLLVLILLASAAVAGSPINMTRAGYAVRGYDVVAYYRDGQPTIGDTQYSYEWQHATWLFASAEHRDLFAAAPDKYIPAFGGYCAYAVGLGFKVDVDPNAWSIVDDRLYLNESLIVRKAWHKDPSYYIALGNEVWDEIKFQ